MLDSLWRWRKQSSSIPCHSLTSGFKAQLLLCEKFFVALWAQNQFQGLSDMFSSSSASSPLIPTPTLIAKLRHSGIALKAKMSWVLVIVFILRLQLKWPVGLCSILQNLGQQSRIENTTLEDFAQSYGKKAHTSSVNFVHSSACPKCRLIWPDVGVQCFKYLEVDMSSRDLLV